MAESLFLRSKSMPTVKVHPLVLFAILDHQTRRNAGEQRVIGALLALLFWRTGSLRVRACMRGNVNGGQGYACMGRAPA